MCKGALKKLFGSREPKQKGRDRESSRAKTKAATARFAQLYHAGGSRRRAHERDVDDEVPVIGADLQIAGEHVEEIRGTEAKQMSDKCRKDYRNRPCVGLCAGRPNADWFRPDQAAGARPYARWLLPE